MKRSVFLSLAGALAVALCGIATPAKAGTVVISDSGSGTATAMGTATGAQIITVSAAIDTVNLAPVSPPLQLGLAAAISGFSGDTITSGTETKVISDGSGNYALLHMSIIGGTATTGTLTIIGLINSVTEPSGMVGGFNFATLIGGTTTVTLTSAGYDFTTLLGTPGASPPTMSSMTITETVPEPTSMGLLGIGMVGFFTYRRFFKRSSVA